MDKLTHQSQIDIGTAALAGVYVIVDQGLYYTLGGSVVKIILIVWFSAV